MAQNNLPVTNSARVGKSLVGKFSERYTIDADKLLDILKATAFKEVSNITDQQMASLLIVADQYKLNPFTREIFAFPQSGTVIPIVSVDGWARITNEHPAMDGVEFRYSETIVELQNYKPCPEWCECLIYRKDRSRATVIREYLDECIVPSSKVWKSHTKRFLRHRAFVQCARVAFGFAGVYEEEEAKSGNWGTGAPIDVTPVEYDTAPFDAAVSASGIDPADPHLAEFIRHSASIGRVSDDKVKAEAAGQIENFISGFKVWLGKRQGGQSQQQVEQKSPAKNGNKPADEPITDDQRAAIMAHYKNSSREDRLKNMSEFLGREVTSFTGLTKAEASDFINAISTDKE